MRFSINLLPTILAMAACTVGLTFGAGPAQAQTESVIFNFDGPVFPADGCSATGGLGDLQPRAGLFFRNGHLFGTTPSGGSGVKGEPDTKAGTVFSLTIPDSGDGKKTNLHSFVNNLEGDGLYPCSRLIGGPNRALFGTTTSGGMYGWGTIFRLKPLGTGLGWSEKVIYNFKGGSWGGLPLDGLVRDTNGNLYGSTSVGGGSNAGYIFMLSPPLPGEVGGWQFSVLYEFAGGVDGSFPNGDLLLDKNTGALFGTTLYGGKSDSGTVFTLTPPPVGTSQWMKTTLWNFSGSDGALPNGGLVGGTGALFGTTQDGGATAGGCCGTVFFLWQESVDNLDYTLVLLHEFGAGDDGSTPWAGLLENPTNTFWGTTTLGGTNGFGTVFELYPDNIRPEVWHYKAFYNFTGGSGDGATPEGVLTVDSTGTLYGTTNAGGIYGRGTVFKLTR